ncbi:hypothetical protein GCM10022227_17650 [Streptomyces sedi]
MPSITIHSTETAITVQMPRAIESRKLTFITDHGSALATRRRALRTRGTVRAPVRGRRTPPPWVLGPWAPGPGPESGRERCCGDCCPTVGALPGGAGYAWGG